MVAVLNWGLSHWWVLFFLSAFGFFDGVRNFLAGIIATVAALGERRHERRLEIERTRSAAHLTAAPAVIADQPLPAAPCRHRNVVSVRSTADDSVVAWLCRGCDSKLPANFSVYEEDL